MASQERSMEALVSIGDSVFGALPSLRKPLSLAGSLVLGFAIWNVPPSENLDAKGVHFLATLVVGVALWILDVFDDYVVGLMLLMSWIVLGIASSKLALAGFSQSSWFFVVAALGLGAAVVKSGLLNRVALRLLNRIPPTAHTTQRFALFASGLVITPLLPTGKARALIALPVAQAIARATGLADRSNGSAALALTALIGFSHMSFMFLTGGEFCLIGWNLLPLQAKAEFGWITWFVAALPAGILIFLFTAIAVPFVFPHQGQGRDVQLINKNIPNLRDLGPLTREEWIGVAVLAATLIGWLTKPLHGIDETWVALGGMLLFLTTGCLDKKSFRNNLDWGLIIFFGIINSMAVISQHMKIDRWLSSVVSPLLTSLSTNHIAFLLAVLAIVVLARVFLRKAAAITLMTLILVPVGRDIGIHPGVLLLTILAASECFFLPYQDGPYQIAYSATDGQAFSHRQAQRLLGVKLLATVAAVVMSIPYWRWLGFIG